MDKQEKSVLDGMPVEDKAFPLRGKLPERKSPPPKLEIVGSCPSCGAPIHGLKTITAGQDAHTTYSCQCWRRMGAGVNDPLPGSRTT
jgi:hypothetical protein